MAPPKFDYSTMEVTWHPNPCADPKLPPLQLEFSDIRVAVTQKHYPRAKDAIEAYWRQAVNMTDKDQEEYKMLLDLGYFIIEQSELGNHTNHRLYEACLAQPTWAKYVLLQALYEETPELDQYMLPLFGSLTIEHLTHRYRQYNPLPGDSNKRRAAAPQPIYPARCLNTAAPLPAGVSTPSVNASDNVSSHVAPTGSMLARRWLHLPIPRPRPRYSRRGTRGASAWNGF